jgi:hypothetical protein
MIQLVLLFIGKMRRVVLRVGMGEKFFGLTPSHSPKERGAASLEHMERG